MFRHSSFGAAQLYLLFDPLLHKFVPCFVHLLSEVLVHFVDVGSLSVVLQSLSKLTEIVHVLAVLPGSQRQLSGTFLLPILHVQLNILNRCAYRKQ